MGPVKFSLEITNLIQEKHRGKKLGSFVAHVFRKVPGVVEVEVNGRLGGTDSGADVIDTTQMPLGNLPLLRKVIARIKLNAGTFFGNDAFDQVITGIKRFDGDVGMLISTAQKSEQLENAVQEASDNVGVLVNLLKFENVAKFAIKHAPELV